MKEKKLQVFVSSTFTDLIQERQAAVEAILSSGNIPAGMELFSAGDESQMNVINRWIDESDVYMLILGGRYGTLEPISGKSYTQLEYEYAVSQNKALFAVVLSEEFIDKKIKIDGKSVLEQENNKQLKEFKDLVTSKMVEFCNDKKDIQLAIFKTLSDFNYSKTLIGWIRGDNSVNTSLLADEIARLTKENDELRKSNISKTESLYNGLTFYELKNLLVNEFADSNSTVHKNCYLYLLMEGERISSGIYVPSHNPRKPLEHMVIKKLAKFKIVKNDPQVSNSNTYVFTDDGHKFYIRCLLDKDI